MSNEMNELNSFKLIGTVGQAVVEGGSNGRALANWGTAPLKYLKPMTKLAFALLVYLLIGVSAWTGLLLRRRIGMNYAILSWTLAIATLALITPASVSLGDWWILNIWWAAIMIAGFMHTVFGIYRMYRAKSGPHDHIHRWASGEPRQVVVWLFNLLPAVIATNTFAAKLREPVAMLVIGLGLWLAQGVLVHDTGQRSGLTIATFWIPIMSSSALLFEMLIGITQAKYAHQKQLDGMFEQRNTGEKLQSINQVSNEREIEGIVTL